MGGGPPPAPLTSAEDLALSNNIGRPVAEGIPGGSSSEPIPPHTSAYIRCRYVTYNVGVFIFHSGPLLVTDGVIHVVEPPASLCTTVPLPLVRRPLNTALCIVVVTSVVFGGLF